MSDADKIWNRAALEGGGLHPGVGDRALAALLLAHGLIMNGGVRHACSALEPAELEAAVVGYRFFGFAAVGLLLQRTATLDDDDEAADDETYWASIPDDGTLVRRFEATYTASPQFFAPL